MTCNLLHSASQSQRKLGLIVSLRKIKVRPVLVTAHFKLLALLGQAVGASSKSWEPLFWMASPPRWLHHTISSWQASLCHAEVWTAEDRNKHKQHPDHLLGNVPISLMERSKVQTLKNGAVTPKGTSKAMGRMTLKTFLYVYSCLQPITWIFPFLNFCLDLKIIFLS